MKVEEDYLLQLISNLLCVEEAIVLSDHANERVHVVRVGDGISSSLRLAVEGEPTNFCMYLRGLYGI